MAGDLATDNNVLCCCICLSAFSDRLLAHRAQIGQLMSRFLFLGSCRLKCLPDLQIAETSLIRGVFKDICICLRPEWKA